MTFAFDHFCYLKVKLIVHSRSCRLLHRCTGVSRRRSFRNRWLLRDAPKPQANHSTPSAYCYQTRFRIERAAEGRHNSRGWSAAEDDPRGVVAEKISQEAERVRFVVKIIGWIVIVYSLNISERFHWIQWLRRLSKWTPKLRLKSLQVINQRFDLKFQLPMSKVNNFKSFT